MFSPGACEKSPVKRRRVDRASPLRRSCADAAFHPRHLREQVVMAMEEEFAVEIPDAEADKITSVSEAIAYLTSNPDAK